MDIKSLDVLSRYHFISSLLFFVKKFNSSSGDNHTHIYLKDRGSDHFNSFINVS